MNKNNLTVNPSKSNAIVFPPFLKSESTLINISLNSCSISNSDSAKCVVIDSKLQFQEHINIVQSKLLRAVGIGILSKLDT